MKRRNFFLYSALFVVSGCTAATQSGNRTDDRSSSTKIKLPTQIRFTVSDAKGLEELKKDYEGLRTTLEQILETKVEFVPVESYIAAVAALQQDQVDLVFTGPSEYVVMRARTNAIPIAAIERQIYYPVIITQAKSGIQSVKALRGKTIAMWEIGSTSGYLGPTKLLIDAGLDPKTDVKIQLLGKKGLAALNRGEVDAWGGSYVRFPKFLEQEKLAESDFRIVAKGPTLPSDPFVLNSKTDALLVQDIQQRLFKNQEKIMQSIATADGNKFQGGKMVEVRDEDYNMIRDVYKVMGEGAFLQG